jgi:Cytochrome c554 and c-prime
MAHALELPAENTVLAAHPSLTYHMGAYTWTVETRNGQSTYTVTDGARTLSLPIHWAFGAGAQTWVFEQNGKFYESIVSYYPSENALAITTGDERLTPQTLDEAMGRELTTFDTKLCFSCHATGAVTSHQLTLNDIHSGVTCAHCHQGALDHAADAALGDFSSAPPHLKDLSAESISNFCGQCHRSWETVVRNGWRGLPDVRFQPYRLANSRCFNGNDPRISCIACHDPHKDLIRDDAFYDTKCLACHAPAAQPTSTGKANPCPVAKSKCVSCHMPKTTLTGGHLHFTDHQIRIVKPNEAFPD